MFIDFMWVLQAIAVSACIRDSWPVLILTPSSLRLHWASVSFLLTSYFRLRRSLLPTLHLLSPLLQTIQQWLNIPPSDILVCCLN